MSASNASGRFPAEIAGILLAEDPFPCVLIDGVVRREIAEIGEGEQAWHVCIVHYAEMPEPVRLIGVNPAKARVMDDAIRFDAAHDFLPRTQCIGRKACILPYRLRDLGKIAEDDGGKAVRGNQVMVGACVVRRAKAGPGHARISYGCPQATVLQRFPCVFLLHGPRADKPIGRLFAVVLLGAQRFEDRVRSLAPLRREHLRAAGSLPIGPRKPHGVTQGICLIFPLPRPRREEGFILIPPVTVRLLVEGVGVGVDADVFYLPRDQPLQQGLQLRIPLRKRQVVAHLCAGIAQPHSRDISSDDKGLSARKQLCRRFICARKAGAIQFKKARDGCERCLSLFEMRKQRGWQIHGNLDSRRFRIRRVFYNIKSRLILRYSRRQTLRSA